MTINTVEVGLASLEIITRPGLSNSRVIENVYINSSNELSISVFEKYDEFIKDGSKDL